MTKLLFVGCGKMGGALLRGVAGRADEIVVVEPKPLAPEILAAGPVRWVAAPDALGSDFAPDAILLAVKPQVMAEVLPLYRRFEKTVFLSIAAGQTLSRLAALLGRETQAIVRAMPNLPASIGQGMCVAVANPSVTSVQRAICDTILSAGGKGAWVEDENLIDAVTALSGSGPAYVFALAEAMAAAGERLGLAPDLAAQLARQTVVGSGALLAQAPESPAALRQAVTSPGGTTAAALAHLMAEEGGLFPLLSRAMAAAAIRAKELSA